LWLMFVRSADIAWIVLEFGAGSGARRWSGVAMADKEPWEAYKVVISRDTCIGITLIYR
jgi:uncharacterized membrane protein